MKITYLMTELKRLCRDFPSMFFIAILPAFFYLIFGASKSDTDKTFGNGNLAMFILIAMAAYGACTATAGIGGRAAVERMQGWGRQLGLTPLTDLGYVATKATLAILVALIPISLTYLLGVLTGASGTSTAWLLSFLALGGGSIVWSLYGLCLGMAFKSDAAVSAATGILVILAFLGNVFIPLSGTMLAIARFTPLYGYVALARYPLTEGYNVDDEGVLLPHESLWIPVANVLVWALIFAVAATLLVRRGRSRQ